MPATNFRSGVCCVVVVLITLSSMADGSAKGSEDAIRDVLTQSTSSIEKNDMASATKIWANDDALTVFESGRANYGWTDYRDNHLIPEMRILKNTQYALNDIKIRIAGQTAWATFKYSISADVAESGKTRRVGHAGLGTAVLEHRQGRWQIVHWHSSAQRRPSSAHLPPKP